MSEATIGIRTEVYGLELHLSAAQLVLAAGGQSLTAPIVLSTDDANRLRMEFAKVQLWEWNQFEELKSRAEKRYRHFAWARGWCCAWPPSARISDIPAIICLCFCRRCRFSSGGGPGIRSRRPTEPRKQNETASLRTGAIFSSERKNRRHRCESGAAATR